MLTWFLSWSFGVKVDVELGDTIVGRLGEIVGLMGYTRSGDTCDGVAKVLVDGVVPPSLRCCTHLYGD